jgi:hypothetical protein
MRDDYPLLTIVHDERGLCREIRIGAVAIPLVNGVISLRMNDATIRVNESDPILLDMTLAVSGIVSEMVDRSGKDGANARRSQSPA